MIAAVLSPGPSLARWTDDDIPGLLRVGVNRAVHYLQCDVWCCGDDRLYREYPVDYAPRISTSEETIRRLKLADTSNCIIWERLFTTYTPASHWMIYSFTAALVTAASLGATDIRVYGCDWAGVEDFDGHKYTFTGEPAEVTRTDKRWENERRFYFETTQMLESMGVSVTRINGNL